MRRVNQNLVMVILLGIWMSPTGAALATPASRPASVPAAQIHHKAGKRPLPKNGTSLPKTGASLPKAGASLSAQAIADLCKQLGVQDAKQRSAAARALGAAQRQLPLVTKALVGALKDKDIHVRWAAVGSLRRLGAASVAALQYAVGQPQFMWRLRAMRVLSFLCAQAGRATPAFLLALRDKHPRVRRDAAQWLGRCGQPVASAVSALINALGDRDWRVALQASHSLRDRGSSALAPLGQALERPLLSLRAAKTLVDLKALGVPVLCRALQAPAWQARYAATYGLGAWKPRQIPCLAQMAKGLRASAWQLRALTAQTLARTRKKLPALLASLTLALSDSTWQVQRQAAYALLLLGQQKPNILPPLLVALDSKHPEASQEAALALARLGMLSLKPLQLRLQHTQQHIRHVAAYALAHMKDKAIGLAIPALHKACSDANKGVRIVAYYALQQAAKHADATVKKSALVALSSIKAARATNQQKKPTPKR